MKKNKSNSLMPKYAIEVLLFYGINDYENYKLIQQRYDHLVIQHKENKKNYFLRF